MSNEHERLRDLCGRLGATPDQADTLARQVARRADQLAAARGWSREQALAHLLRLLTEGSAGIAPAGFEGGPPPSPDRASASPAPGP
ncbi:MAG: hypothetical protein FJ382_13155 [Verrucomicrobia bacterium]|nr:hypothetical protein [Verrucomicrobiota bacterium]